MATSTVNPPAERAYRPIRTPTAMLAELQRAIELELSTIPPYLTALYSIEDKTSDAYQAIRDVVLEEMLHVNLVSNLINALGGTPRLTGDACPSYPGYLPVLGANGPYVELLPATVEQVGTTFMAIENPAPVDAPAEDEVVDTIGQFYKAIEIGFRDYSRRSWFVDGGVQATAFYFGSGAGRVVEVTGRKSALEAIEEIVKQGEGASNLHEPLVPYDPFGNYENYGMRTDGTYGPILGSARELSHYYRFKDLADGTIPLPATYPMIDNPDPRTFTNPVARALAQIFDECYSALLYALQEALSGARRDDPFFTVVFPLMQSVVPALAQQLLTTPVDPHGSATTGPNAGPPFRWVDSRGGARNLLRAAGRRTARLIEEYREPAYGDQTLATLVATLTSVRRTLDEIRGRAPSLFE